MKPKYWSWKTNWLLLLRNEIPHHTKTHTKTNNLTISTTKDGHLLIVWGIFCMFTPVKCICNTIIYYEYKDFDTGSHCDIGNHCTMQ